MSRKYRKWASRDEDYRKIDGDLRSQDYVDPSFPIAQGVLFVAAGEFLIEHKPPTKLVPKDWASRLLVQVKGSRYEVRSCERGNAGGVRRT